MQYYVTWTPRNAGFVFTSEESTLSLLVIFGNSLDKAKTDGPLGIQNLCHAIANDSPLHAYFRWPLRMRTTNSRWGLRPRGEAMCAAWRGDRCARTCQDEVHCRGGPRPPSAGRAARNRTRCRSRTRRGRWVPYPGAAGARARLRPHGCACSTAWARQVGQVPG